MRYREKTSVVTKILRLSFVFFAMASALGLPAADAFNLSIRWGADAPSGEITVVRGRVTQLTVDGVTAADTSKFSFTAHSPGRLDIAVEPDAGAVLPTFISVKNSRRTFTFGVEDVDVTHPIFLPDDQVVITTVTDAHTFAEIVGAIRQQHSFSKLQRIDAAGEETFPGASGRVRETKSETWLGLGRDIRLFRVDAHLDSIQPRLAGRELMLPESPGQQIAYEFGAGRGWGVRDQIKRQLDGGTLPILHAAVDDDSVHYELTVFSTLEQQALTAENVRGTEYLIADYHSHGHSFTAAQAAEYERVKKVEGTSNEETVLRARLVATNRGSEPGYAFLRVPVPVATVIGKPTPASSFDGKAGMGAFDSGRIFVGATLNGQPAHGGELSPFLQPGQQAVLDFVLPHSPVTRERMTALLAQSFDQRLAETRSYWQKKLASGAQWRLPESRIEDMIRAGLLHLDLVAYGREPNGPLLPAIGIYAAIGSESSPIIQFMDSMGWHDTAARALDYFLAKQHDDGFMQNFNGYMLETGAVVWSMGEHYRYTRDDAWLRRVHAKLSLACSYLENRRKKNLQPELVGDGYGMIDGKTADPEDPYRSFMLNGYAYLGLSRAAEILKAIAPEESQHWRDEADALKTDIRASLRGSMERAPVVPLGDGTWSRTAAPWTGYRGPVALHADGGRWYTHWTLTGRDSLLGPLYLVFQEVLDPNETEAEEILQTQSELMLTEENVAFSQPYYSRHPWVHLQRGESKPFLKAWYNSVAALADRETYTFTEHFFPVSAHKTHEEAWFLMEARWMLYLESGTTLRLLSGAPRPYFAPGKSVTIDHAKSYFGDLSFRVDSSATKIEANVICEGSRHPDVLEIRLPHFEGKKPTSIVGGVYNAETEVVRIENFGGRATVTLTFEISPAGKPMR